jgi:N-acetylmuramoyl-L-alanine amidase
MHIENHRLKNAKIKFESTKKHGDKFGANLPDTIILHYTAARDLQSAQFTLSKSSTQASAHLIIGRTGDIVQLVDFDTVSWHAGRSEHKERKWLNRYSIGIEIDNPGWLKKSGNKYTTWFAKEVDMDEVVELRHRNPETTQRYWHRYTEQQVQIVEEICDLLVKEYKIKYILGHEEVSPGRKQDPGPAFPLDKIRSNILEGDRNQMDGPEDDIPFKGVVNVNTGLNIRADASAVAKKVAQPLTNNQTVQVVEEKNDWYKVKTEIEGWVSKRFIRRQF